MGRRQEKNIDRISQLPTYILHDILSNLSVKDEVRTCVLSKSWYTDVWSSLPPRTFNFMRVDSKIRISTNHYTVKRHPKEFVNDVESSFNKLDYERFIIAAFNISLEVLNDKHHTLVDCWLQLAVKNGGLRRLCIYSSPNLYRYMVRTDIALASAAPLKELELTGCFMRKSSLCDGDVGALPLKRLSLVCCVFSAEGDFQKFISRCTSLEYLRMDCCTGVKYLQLGKLSKLKELVVIVKRPKSIIDHPMLAKVDVDSSSVQNIRIVGCRPYSLLVVNIARCRNLQHLYLCSLKIENQHFLRNLAISYQLHTLYLESCCGLESPTVLRHHQLQTMQLFNLPTEYSIEIDTPNLFSLELKGDIFPSLCLSDKSSNSRPLRQFTLNLEALCPLYTTWFIQFRAFLAHSLKNCVNLSFNASLIIYTCTYEFDVDIARRGLRTYDRACDIEDLTIHLRQSFENYATFFDGIFWCCRPKRLSVKLDGPRNQLLTDIQEIVMITREGDSTACCMSSPVKCWRHFVNVTTDNYISEEIVLMLDWF